MSRMTTGAGRVALVSLVLMATAGPVQAAERSDDGASSPREVVYSATEAFGVAAAATDGDRVGESEKIIIMTPTAVSFAVTFAVGALVGYLESSGKLTTVSTLQESMLD